MRLSSSVGARGYGGRRGTAGDKMAPNGLRASHSLRNPASPAGATFDPSHRTRAPQCLSSPGDQTRVRSLPCTSRCVGSRSLLAIPGGAHPKDDSPGTPPATSCKPLSRHHPLSRPHLKSQLNHLAVSRTRQGIISEPGRDDRAQEAGRQLPAPKPVPSMQRTQSAVVEVY